MDGANQELCIIVGAILLRVWLRPGHGLERVRGDTAWARGFPVCHMAEGGPYFIGRWWVSELRVGRVRGDEIQRCDVAGKRVLIVENFVKVCTKYFSILFICERFGPICFVHADGTARGV
eukprot:8739645-Ditylum_brightwellii.AAC.1